MSYLDFLNKILALGGTKIPQLLAALPALLTAIQSIIAIFQPTPVAHSHTFNATPEQDAAEQQILKACEGHHHTFAAAAGVGVSAAAGEASKIDVLGLLRTLWTTIQANPALLTFILSLLKVA